jgi:carboxylate-amine ligase
MTADHSNDFRFGLEAEFMLVDAASFQPLWIRELEFKRLNATLEAIPIDDFEWGGLKVEPPHRKRGAYVVEGYHVPDPQMNPIDLLPKGVEIRTPICTSIEECVGALKVLHGRLQRALARLDYRAAILSFHPTERHFEGPQNKRRHDFWQWAMAAMLTYGPDVNVGLPKSLERRIDLDDLHLKANYYAPALTALTLASPLCHGGLWRIRGRVGKSVRTYHRSAIAPVIEIHPDEGLRLEFKPLEMSRSLADYHAFFLVWLAVILDDRLEGRASDQTRIYDLGRIAREGLEAETVRDRAGAILDRAPCVLDAWGFDFKPLDALRERLATGRLPADDIIELYERERSIPGVLRHLADFT